MSNDQPLRAHVLALLRGGNAHLTFEQAVADFPAERLNSPVPNAPYTPWQIIEHMRIAQRDILEFIRDPDYVSPKWPEGYWPDPAAQIDAAQWEQLLDDFRADIQAMQDLVADPDTDLLAPIPHAPDYTILREALLVADHNAYHIGEFAILRQVMGTWPESR